MEKAYGLVTDAGTPGISDPGEVIVKEAIKEGIKITPIPGACALINALITSGLNTKEFVFYGFLPLNKKLRDKTFKDIEKQNRTIIIYEAPHRILKTVCEIEDRYGNIEIVLAKEITKIHETFFRGKIEDIKNSLSNPKGEFIILFEMQSATEEEKRIEDINKLSIEEQFEIYINQGCDKKEAIKQIAKNNNVAKNEIYKKFI